MEENPVLTETVHIEPSEILIKEKLDIQTNVDKEDKVSANESDYDSAGNYSEESEYKENTGGGSKSENESDVEGSIILERQEGDGQESIPQKKVDDDEDKKNPQYIPKRGTFYEHDDRTADDIEAAELEEKEKQDKESKKKLWQDKKERWSHDKFNDSEQAPKSKSELVQIYGYDIRNEDGPPRARRRRRYGRGPNKYTRNWEDEDAYNKTVPQRPIKKPQKAPSDTNEEFPPLNSNNRKYAKQPEMKPNTEPPRNNKDNDTTEKYNRQNTRRSEEREEPSRTDQAQNIVNNTVSNNNKPVETGNNASSSDNKNSKVGSGRVNKSRIEIDDSKNIRDSDCKGFTTKTRLLRNMKSQNSNVKNQKAEDFIQSQSFTPRRNGGNGRHQELEDSMGNLNIHESKVYERSGQGKSQQNSQRQGSVPPRLQGEQKGSKRYSSIRQRSLPETNNPPMMQHNYYANDPQQPQGTVMHQNSNLLQAPNSITQLAPAPNLPMTQPVPVTAPPMLQAAPQFATGFPQQAFIQAAVPAPAFLQQQAPPLINYVQTPAPFPAGYPAGFQPPFNPVSQSTELYQPQGGITYYSTDQQIPQRTVPLKRPKAAIPIVAPPSFDQKNYKEEERRLEYPSETNSVE